MNVTTTERVCVVEQELSEPKNYKYVVFRIGKYCGHSDNNTANFAAAARITLESGVLIEMTCDGLFQAQDTTRRYGKLIAHISPKVCYSISGSNVNLHNGVTFAPNHNAPKVFVGNFSGKITKVGFGIDPRGANTMEIDATIEVWGVR